LLRGGSASNSIKKTIQAFPGDSVFLERPVISSKETHWVLLGADQGSILFLFPSICLEIALLKGRFDILQYLVYNGQDFNCSVLWFYNHCTIKILGAICSSFGFYLSYYFRGYPLAISSQEISSHVP
jgi:hypothetical protein